MSSFVHLDRDGGRPLYRQVVDGIVARIRTGSLAPGARLPTVRALARELAVTRPTVHKAYAALRTAGYVTSTVGRGTFVCAVPGLTAAAAARRITPDDVMSDIQRLRAEPGLTRLAHAEPDPALCPTRDFWRALARLEPDARELLQYGSTQGDGVLRAELAALLRTRGIAAAAADVIVTAGVTQGLSLAVESLAARGDTVLVEQPTYLGLLQILEQQGVRPLPVPLDDEGPRLDVLERLVVEHQPRLFYTIPSFHNPTGVNMSADRRRAVAELAARHALVLVEDDLYRALAYEREPPPPLKAVGDPELVIYLDGFSKLALPGLRAGYAVPPRRLRDRMLRAKRASDLCGPPLLERALGDFLHAGALQRHMRRAVPRYRRRRDALLTALAETMPDGVEWTRPAGGFCCWLSYPRTPRLADLYRAARDRALVVAPGEVFLTGKSERGHLRLTFGNESEAVLRRAATALAELFAERMSVSGQLTTAGDWTPMV